MPYITSELNGFSKGTRIEVVAGRTTPIGYKGTVTMVLEDKRFGQHMLLVVDTGHLNEAGLDRWRVYMKNANILPDR